jgi:hypothetical protein
MGAGASAAWKALPIRQRLLLSLFLAVSTQAVLYVVIEAPSHSHASLGVPIAVAIALLSAIGLIHFYRRWVIPELGTASANGSGRLAFVLILLLAIYLLVSAYPIPLFPNRVSHAGITVYSDRELEPEIYAVLERAVRNISTSAVYDSSVHHRVFLAGSHGKFAFFAQTHFRAFGIRSPLMGNIFVTKSDPAADRVIARRDGEYNQRSLSGVIAHEITHALLRQTPGGRGLPTWKEEGYADYIAGESTFDYACGVELLKAGEHDPSPAFRYFKHRLLVEYLLDLKQVPFEQFLTEYYDPWKLEVQVVAELH